MAKGDYEYLLVRARNPSHITATGDVYAQGKQGSITAVVLTAGVDAATATFKDGGSGGTIVLVVSAALGTSQPVSLPSGLIFADGLHVTLTGTAPTVDVVGVADDA